MAALSPKAEIIISSVAYSLCSGSLVLVNKVLLHYLPFPSLVVTFQLWSTLLFIICADVFGILKVDQVRWKFIKPYMAYTASFSLGVYCNMKSLSISNVETIIVSRALAPLLVSVADAAFLGREWPSMRSWGALGTIVLGAVGYACTDEQFLSQGLSAYSWPSLYLFVISFEMAYGKKIVSGVDLKTLSGPVLYTNLLGWPPMLLFAKGGNEYDGLYQMLSSGVDNPLHNTTVVVLLFVGCVVGTGIGYSGWWCRSKVSATSYTIIGVMNKCLTVMANCLIWDQHASPTGIACLSLCLVGGVFYRQAPMRKSYGMENASSLNLESRKGTSAKDSEEVKEPLLKNTEMISVELGEEGGYKDNAKDDNKAT